jgi:glycosyltransferase involved in cell wall biosynthesis
MVMTKGSNLLMIIGLFHPIVGGAEKVCQALSKRFMEKGISVTVLTQYRDGLPEYEVIDGVPVYRKMKGWHPFGLAYMVSVFSFLIKHRRSFDIICCFGLFLFIPPAVLMKYLYKKKVVVRLMCSGDFGDFAGIKPLPVKRLITAAAKRGDTVVYISQDIKKELQENHFPSEKLVHIPNGVDIERFAPLKGGDHQASKNICFVGRLEAQKGLESLMEALASIISRDSGVTLTLVGEGQERATLEDLARSRSLARHVVFAGFDENVLPHYHSARVFVLPSRSEGMSSSLLEAMSCGLPVVVTTVGGNREMVDWGSAPETIPISQYQIADCGILVNPEDSRGLAGALSKLLEDTALVNQLGERARKYICSRYSQEKIVNDYLTLFSRLLPSMYSVDHD